jgi:hypothetical protein
VRGAFLTVQRPLQPPVLGVGVDHVDQVTPGPGQVGGIQTGRGLHHHLLPPRPHHPPLPLPPAQTPDMGHPVTGRPEVKPVLGQVTGLGLDHRPRLHRRSRRDQHLQTLHHTDQHLVGLGRPQHLPQPPQPAHQVGDHTSRRGPGRLRGIAGIVAGIAAVDRHTNIESAPTDNPADIHHGYPAIRDHPQKLFPGTTFRPQEPTRHTALQDRPHTCGSSSPWSRLRSTTKRSA